MSTLLLFASVLVGEAAHLAKIRPAPDFTLTGQDGKELRLRDLRGKVVLVSFVFTTCNGSCPPTTSRLVQIQQRLQERGLLKSGKVQLLTITLDPKRDTPEALGRYAKQFDADTASWTFLTGTPEQVTKVHAAWGMWTKPAANGQLDHPSRVFLVDGQGVIREIYDLGFLKPAWVVEDIEALTTSANRRRESPGATQAWRLTSPVRRAVAANRRRESPDATQAWRLTSPVRRAVAANRRRESPGATQAWRLTSPVGRAVAANRRRQSPDATQARRLTSPVRQGNS